VPLEILLPNIFSRMTLSTRRAQVSKRQVGLLGNARISKSNKSEIDTKAIALEFFALEVQSSTAAKATKPVKAAKPAKAVSKRKRVEDESETAPTGPIEKWVTSKKVCWPPLFRVFWN
jgi:hypothetical protein